MKRIILGLSAMFAAAFAQSAIEGEWEGAILIQGVQLSMNVEFSQENAELKGFIDIPQQGANGIPLEDESFDGGRVYFELPANMTAVFSGELADERITGTFTQGPAKGEFYLERTVEEVLPYTSEEVSIEVSEEVTLAGTLTIPEGEGSFPAVALISGSGQQTRDVDIFGFKLFATIADHLTRKGIVVLRCDDRGFGSSTGETDQATSEDFTRDALAQVAYLESLPQVDTAQVGLLGHSEGALITSMVDAERDAVDFSILVAGPAVPGEELLLAQQRHLLEAEGLSDKEVEEASDLQKQIFDAVRAGNQLDEFKPEMRKIIKKGLERKIEAGEASLPSDTTAYVERLVQAQLKMVQSPWMRFFLDYDPREDIAHMSSRVLAMFGENDMQVPAEMNAEAMDSVFAAAGKENYLIKICCKANHLFQPAETGAVSEYAKLPKEFTSCFLPTVTAWILEEPIPEKCDETDESHQGCPRSKEQGCGGCPHH